MQKNSTELTSIRNIYFCCWPIFLPSHACTRAKKCQSFLTLFIKLYLCNSDVISTSPKACVEFLNLEDRVFKKVQCRKGGHARQIIEEGQPVEMKAIYSAGSSLMAINGWIRRMYPESNCITRGSCDLNIDSAIFKEKDTVLNMLENRLSKEGEDEAGIEVIDGHEFRTVSSLEFDVFPFHV